ncbi:MAG: hypothetical protein SVS15_05685 [Thermodesulfobacteriota bacterium]|nr:hypothetical protein [Thermodesulfobacteriota bacterium]
MLWARPSAARVLVRAFFFALGLFFLAPAFAAMAGDASSAFCEPEAGFDAFTAQVFKQQYFSAQDLYVLPVPGFEDFSRNLLRQEPADLILAREVSAYAEDSGTLGFAKGNALFIRGKDFCLKTALPKPKDKARLLSWPGKSPYLAACGEQKVFVYNVRRGKWVRGAHDLGQGVSGLALSSYGAWLALVDHKNRVWAGPTLGPLKRGPNLSGDLLALDFSPDQGVLMVVDVNGQTLLWAMHTGKLIHRFRVPGGPFERGFFQDKKLFLAASGQGGVVWDVVRQEPVRSAFEPSSFSLDDGVLSYRTGRLGWTRTRVLQRETLGLYFSESAKAFKLWDLDGEERCFSFPSGMPIGPVQALDWERLSDTNRVYHAHGKAFRACDLIYQKGRNQLFCRFVPGKGFYVWWEDARKEGSFNPHPFALPRRDSLSADKAPRMQFLRDR